MTASFDDLFVREHSRIVRLAYALTRSNELAQDVAQDAFVRLLERWDSVDNPEGFLRTVVVNRIRDLERRRKVSMRAQPRLAVSTSVDDDLDHLFDALAALPAQRRAVVVLRFYEQRTVPEIADLLGMRLGTVSSGLTRSLDTLRRSLA